MIQNSNKTSSGSDFLNLEVALSHSSELTQSVEKESGSLLTMLVVDDDADMRTYISDCLHDHFGNIHVLVSENGQAAFDLLSHIKPSVLITDLNMPVMNGLELIANIQSTFSDWSVPVLIISGKDQHPANDQKVRSLSNWDVLKKPFSEETLIHSIQNLLSL